MKIITFINLIKIKFENNKDDEECAEIDQQLNNMKINDNNLYNKHNMYNNDNVDLQF